MSDDVIRLSAVRDTPIGLDEVFAACQDAKAGGTVLFVGTVRDQDEDKQVTALEYSSHPSVEQTMREVLEKVAAEHPAIAIAALHRVGKLAIGDIAVVVGASAMHRGEAFAAGRQLIEDLKHKVPIWKLQTFADGTDEWVGCA
jgi:molybdopterin synthase catalytic subunit